MQGERHQYKSLPMSLRLASQILTDMGIANRRVTTFSDSSAERKIRKHLEAGKPVIIKVGSGRYKGIHFTNAHHTLVLIGIEKGYVVFINPVGGVNKSTVGSVHRNINLKLSTLVKKFMYSSEKGTEGAYVTDYNDAGGFILAG